MHPHPWNSYELALELACQTIHACLVNASLTPNERAHMHAALSDLRLAWGTPGHLERPIHTLQAALNRLPDDCALPARVSLQTISQWEQEVQEAYPRQAF